MDQLNLSDFFTTKAGAVDFTSRLAAIIDQIYAADFKLDPILLEQFGYQRKDKFMALLRDNNVNLESNSALQEFFESLRQKASSLPVISLTLAFEPHEDTLRDLSEWFASNTSHQVLLDIKVDSGLIAGAAVTYNGQFQDFSVRSRFEQLMTEVLASQAASTPG